MAIKRLTDGLRAAWDGLSEDAKDCLRDTCDSSCTTGYDNDGSTGYEIFENGFRLGQSAGDSDVFVVRAGGSALFFVGSEEQVLAVFQEAADDTAEAEDQGEDEAAPADQ